MAVELLKAMTPAGSPSRPILRNQKAALQLAKVATDADPVTAKDATAALVNLTDDHVVVAQLAGTNLIPTLVESICVRRHLHRLGRPEWRLQAKDNKLISLHIMLLNNITTFDEGARVTMQESHSSLFVARLPKTAACRQRRAAAAARLRGVQAL